MVIVSGHLPCSPGFKKHLSGLVRCSPGFKQTRVRNRVLFDRISKNTCPESVFVCPDFKIRLSVFVFVSPDFKTPNPGSAPQSSARNDPVPGLLGRRILHLSTGPHRGAHNSTERCPGQGPADPARASSNRIGRTVGRSDGPLCPGRPRPGPPGKPNFTPIHRPASGAHSSTERCPGRRAVPCTALQTLLCQ